MVSAAIKRKTVSVLYSYISPADAGQNIVSIVPFLASVQLHSIKFHSISNPTFEHMLRILATYTCSVRIIIHWIPFLFKQQ